MLWQTFAVVTALLASSVAVGVAIGDDPSVVTGYFALGFGTTSAFWLAQRWLDNRAFNQRLQQCHILSNLGKDVVDDNQKICSCGFEKK